MRSKLSARTARTPNRRGPFAAQSRELPEPYSFPTRRSSDLLPLQFLPGETAETLGLDGTEAFDITGIASGLTPGQGLTVEARKNGVAKTFQVIVRLDIPIEAEYYRHGGILPYVVRQLAAGGRG